MFGGREIVLRNDVVKAGRTFSLHTTTAIQDGKLKLQRDDKVAVPPAVTTLPKVINARLPLIRIA